MSEVPVEYIKRICEMFKSYGIRSVTMDDVSRDLGISKKTLYSHFKDKAQLVEIILFKEFNERVTEIASAMADKESAIEELFEFYRVQVKIITQQKPNFIYDLKKYYPQYFEEFSKLKREKMMGLISENLVRGKKEGLYRKDLNVNVAARLHSARIESIMASGLFSNEELVSADFFAETFKYHIYAIVSNKGRDIVNSNIEEIIKNAK
jgi:AcrR family transcriptional regulator